MVDQPVTFDELEELQGSGIDTANDLVAVYDANGSQTRRVKRVTVAGLLSRVSSSGGAASLGALNNVQGSADTADPNDNFKLLVNDPRSANPASSRWRAPLVEGTINTGGIFLLDGAGILDNTVTDTQLASGNYDSIIGIGRQGRDLDMALNQVVGLGDPVGPRNAATKSYVDTAVSGVSGGTPGANSIGTTQLADGSVTTPKLADNAVTTAKVANGAITADKIASGVIPGASTVNRVQITSANGGTIPIDYDYDINVIIGTNITTFGFSNQAPGKVTEVYLQPGQTFNYYPAFRTLFQNDTVDHTFNFSQGTSTQQERARDAIFNAVSAGEGGGGDHNSHLLLHFKFYARTSTLTWMSY